MKDIKQLIEASNQETKLNVQRTFDNIGKPTEEIQPQENKAFLELVGEVIKILN